MSVSEIKIYQLDNGQAEVQVRFENETVWLSQKCKIWIKPDTHSV